MKSSQRKKDAVKMNSNVCTWRGMTMVLLTRVGAQCMDAQILISDRKRPQYISEWSCCSVCLVGVKMHVSTRSTSYSRVSVDDSLSVAIDLHYDEIVMSNWSPWTKARLEPNHMSNSLIQSDLPTATPRYCSDLWTPPTITRSPCWAKDGR